MVKLAIPMQSLLESLATYGEYDTAPLEHKIITYKLVITREMHTSRARLPRSMTFEL